MKVRWKKVSRKADSHVWIAKSFATQNDLRLESICDPAQLSKLGGSSIEICDLTSGYANQLWPLPAHHFLE